MSCARQHQSELDRGITAAKHRNPLSRGERVRAVRLPTSSHFLALRGLSASPLADTRLAIRCVENALNGFIEHSIELSVRLLSRKPFNQRPGKAGDHAMIFAQTIVCFFPRIASRERNHPQNPGMFDKLGVEVVLLRQRKLEHDELTTWQFVHFLEDGCFEQLLRFSFFWAVNIN